MADVAMGNLRFDLTADNSQFMAAVKQAKEMQTLAASEMGKQFEAASKRAEEATSSMLDKIGAKTFETIKTLQTLGKSLGEAFSGGADTAEKLTSDLFKKVMTSTEGAVRKWVNSIPGGIGKFITAAFDLLDSSGAIGKGWDVIGKVAAQLGDRALEKLDTSKLTKGLRDGIVSASESTNDALGRFFDKDTIDEQQKQVSVFADNVQGKLDEMIEGARTALQKIAETWQGVREEVQKAVSLSDTRTRSTEFQTFTLGMQPGEKAAAVERQQMLADIGKAYSDLNKAEKEELATRESAAAMAAIDRVSRLAGIDFLKKYEQALDALRKKNADGAFQQNFLGATTQERTEAAELARVIDTLGGSWNRLTEAQKIAAVEEAKTAGVRAQAIEDQRKAIEQSKQHEQAVASLTSALKRQGDMALANAGRNAGKSAYDLAIERGNAMAESYGRGRNAGITDDPRVKAAIEEAARQEAEAKASNYRTDQSRMLREANDKGYLEQSTLGARPGESEKLRVEMELMNKARREGVTLDAGQVALNASIASSMGQIAQATAEARERYEAFREVGRTVASSLEDAFGKFINGTQVHWKEFINSLQQDLAKLAFRRGIESLLTGGVSSGGGIFGALAGVFGGFRADGGSVGSGKGYIVGERGPEVFVPQSAGSIVPNHAMGGGGATTINMRIDLAGANGDEAIARISAQAARQAAMQAVQASNDAFPQRQRSLQLLGA